MENINDEDKTPEDEADDLDAAAVESGGNTQTDYSFSIGDTDAEDAEDAENAKNSEDADKPEDAADALDNIAGEDVTDTFDLSSEANTDTIDDMGDGAFTDGSFTDGDAFDDGGGNEPFDAEPPPQPQQFPTQSAATTGLTRDPFATFGGVISGIAHRYGWDVSLARLAFVVLLFISGGTALLGYLLAWLIIPRATFWPPVPAPRRGGLSGRDFAIGLIGFGGLIALGAGSGDAAVVLVPLALIGSGVWLLSQNPRSETVSASAGMSPQATVGMAAPAMAYAGATAATGQPYSAQPMATSYATQPLAPPSQPVPKRSRGRKFAFAAIFGIIAAGIAFLILAIIIIVSVASDGVNLEFNEDPIHVDPQTISEIPERISESNGELIVDLRDVDFSTITIGDDPVELGINLDAGRIEVLLPEDVRVSINAETDFFGELDVLGEQLDGISRDYFVDHEDPQLVLDLEVNVGEIVVSRGE